MALRVTAILDADGARFNRVMGQADRTVQALGRRIAALFTVGMVVNFTRQTVQWAAGLTDLSARLGVSVEELQRMQAAAEAAGLSLEQMAKSYQYLASAQYLALKDPKGTQAEGFAALGVSREQLQMASVESLFKTLTQFVRDTQNVESIIGPLKEVFGRGGADLIEAFATYAGESIQGMAVVSAETAGDLDTLTDSIALLKQETMAGLSPVIVSLIDTWKELQKSLEATITGILVAIDKLKREDPNAIAKQANSAANWIRNPILKAIIASATGSKDEVLKKAADAFVEGFAASVEKDIKDAETDDPGKKKKFRNVAEFVPPDPTKQTKSAAFYSDALLSVGNFLGSRSSTLEQASRLRQMTYDKISEMNSNIARMLQKLEGGGTYS